MDNNIIHPHKERIPELVQETVDSAHNIHNAWDQRNLEWDLTEDSVVFEVGSYRGRWALQMAEKFNPRLFCFEPQPWAYDVTRHVLEDYPNAQVFNYGLGVKNDTLAIGQHDTDGASFVRNGGMLGIGKVRSIVEILPELGVETIDLMMVNIEGYEYVLLPYMFGWEIFPKILVVQFHNYDGRNLEPGMRETIQDHYVSMWDYGHVLSAWELK